MVEDEEGIESQSKSFVFMVSDRSDQQMRQMEEATAMLGGRIASDPATFDPLATHLVTSSVAQTEKVVMSVAAGLWLLHPSYVAESLSRGRWLREENFEWAGWWMSRWEVTKEGKELADAALYWKITGGRAFLGMKAMKA